MSMKDFAHHIIAVANENNLPITNLQLQKVMYFTFKDALINQTYDKKWFDTVYDSPFLVWRYGPVEKDIYETYNIYGASPIIEKNEINPKFNRLNKFIIENLKKIHLYWLINLIKKNFGKIIKKKYAVGEVMLNIL